MPSEGSTAPTPVPAAGGAPAIARGVLIALLPSIGGTSGVDGYIEAVGFDTPAWWYYGSTVFLTLLIFSWYHFDSRARGFRRSKLMNIAVLAVAVAGIPWYVFRSRPAAERKRALLRMLAYIVVAVLCGLGGEWIGGAIADGWKDAE